MVCYKGPIMENLHYVSITFPDTEDGSRPGQTDKSLANSMKNVFPKRHFALSTNDTVSSSLQFPLPKIPKKHLSKTNSPTFKKPLPAIEYLHNYNRSHVFSEEDKYVDKKDTLKTGNIPEYSKNASNYNSKYYMKFYDRIEKQQMKRFGKQTQRRQARKDYPLRYGANAPSSVIDVALLAQSTFNQSTGKKIDR
jgi:hypothetical protein